MALTVSFPPILKNRQFLKLWGNQILLQVAFNMCIYTSLLIIGFRTHSPFIQSILYAVLTVPAFLFGLVAGPVVDFVDRKKLMLTTDTLLFVLFLFYAFVSHDIFLILFISFLASSVAQFFTPAEAATIPTIVEGRMLQQANALFLFTLLGSVIAGYALAGPIIQLFGGLGTKGELAPFYIAVVMLALGFLLRLTLRPIHTPKPKVPEGHVFRKSFVLFWETIQEVSKNKHLSIPLILIMFVELNIGMFSIVLLEYVRRYLQLPLTSITYVLMIPFVLGVIVATALLETVQERFGYKKPLFVACFITGVVYVFFGLVPYFGVAVSRGASVVFAFLIGIIIVFIAVISRTLLGIHAKVHMQGRVFSILNVLIALATPIPVLLLGFFADRLNILIILILYGILVLLITLISTKIVKL